MKREDNIIRPSDLSVEELVLAYRDLKKSSLMEMIISRSDSFIHKIIGSIKHNIEKEEVAQLAYKGLLVAINRFNPAKKTKFFTYAYYCIKGEILNHIRDNGMIKYPRWVWNLNKIFNDFIKDFQKKENRYPNLEEISKGINLSTESVNELLRIRESLYKHYSLDDAFDVEGLNSIKKNIKSREYKSFTLPMEDKILLWNAIDGLKSINKKILILKYFFGYSQQEIGFIMGVSQKNVSRRLNESINELRGSMT